MCMGNNKDFTKLLLRITDVTFQINKIIHILMEEQESILM